ncbi:demethoxyubiquinone hydroxylase family protein [Undibacterium sp. Ji50W]|uniref:demethoxyubiquinone hydroxylase family protein n=1 Tax=Undibacterium sp. Ji50W TaxID=3413041 RepID=UPI003BF1D0F4
MKYQECTGTLDTASKILKVNHAGEFGAINIYRSQILVSKLFGRSYVPILENFMADEKRHLNTFWTEIQKRNSVKCKSYWLCGLGGWAMGLISALFGKTGIMACTWAVESVVINHLNEQLVYLNQRRDWDAYEAVKSILEDEKNHRDIGHTEGGSNILYIPFRFMISTFTEGVIRIGMR